MEKTSSRRTLSCTSTWVCIMSPNTGDLPNTVFSTAQSGMMILPHNYLLSDPSRQATQQIRIDYNNNSTTDVYSWDSQIAAGKLDFSQFTWDPYTYDEDVSVRKFPYDPRTHSITVSNGAFMGMLY